MAIHKEIEKLNESVMLLLVGDPRLRDSDKKLSARIWTEQLGGIDKMKRLTAYDFLVLYTDDNAPLYSQESIGRARRLIQEHNPELRGAKWKERKNEEKEVSELVVSGIKGYGKPCVKDDKRILLLNIRQRAAKV